MHFFTRRVGMFVQEGLGGHHKSWSAEAALLSVVLDECSGNRMQLPRGCEAVSGDDLFALSFKSQHRARVHRFVIGQHRACATQSSIAYALRSGYLEAFAKSVKQSNSGLEIRSQTLSVYGERDRNFARAVNLNFFSGSFEY